LWVVPFFLLSVLIDQPAKFFIKSSTYKSIQDQHRRVPARQPTSFSLSAWQKKTKQKKARAWRRARHSRLPQPLFNEAANLKYCASVALQLEVGCDDSMALVNPSGRILLFSHSSW